MNDMIIEILLHCVNINDITAVFCACKKTYQLKEKTLQMIKIRNLHLKKTVLYIDTDYRSFLNILGDFALELIFVPVAKSFESIDEGYAKEMININNYNAKKHIDYCMANFTSVHINFKNRVLDKLSGKKRWEFMEPNLQLITSYTKNFESINDVTLLHEKQPFDEVLDLFERDFEKYCKDTLLCEGIAKILFNSIYLQRNTGAAVARWIRSV